eukprot:gene12443-16590_t
MPRQGYFSANRYIGIIRFALMRMAQAGNVFLLLFVHQKKTLPAGCRKAAGGGCCGLTAPRTHDMSDLLFMPATAAAALIRGRRLSPVEYVEAVLAAIDAQQPRLNAFVTVMHEQARADARAAEQAVAEGADLGPLHGVPIHIKDLVDVAGVRTTNGSAIFADNVATRDDIQVARLRAAGAIIVGKTTTPEFGVKGLTDGPSFGIARNPWNTDRTPGGSSGGAAAA